MVFQPYYFSSIHLEATSRQFKMLSHHCSNFSFQDKSARSLRAWMLNWDRVLLLQSAVFDHYKMRCLSYYTNETKWKHTNLKEQQKCCLSPNNRSAPNLKEERKETMFCLNGFEVKNRVCRVFLCTWFCFFVFSTFASCNAFTALQSLLQKFLMVGYTRGECRATSVLIQATWDKTCTGH